MYQSQQHIWYSVYFVCMCDTSTTLLQDVRDNKTEAANAAPQALRLCQMVGSTASNFHTHMHCGSKTSTSSHTYAIALVLPLTNADTICQHECVSYIHVVYESGGLSQTQFAQMFIMSHSTVKVVIFKVAEQPVRAPAKPWAGWPVCAFCKFEPNTDFLYDNTFWLRAPATRTLHFRCVLEHSGVDCLPHHYLGAPLFGMYTLPSCRNCPKTRLSDTNCLSLYLLT